MTQQVRGRAETREQILGLLVLLSFSSPSWHADNLGPLSEGSRSPAILQVFC